jgi:hypothetical protein
MPVRIRRGRGILDEFLHRATERAADALAVAVEDVIESALETIRPVERPHDPFWQLDALCPRCGLRMYESGNQIVLCLACWILVDGQDVDPVPRQQQAQAQAPWRHPNDKRPTETSRAYKVPKAGRKGRRPSPQRPQYAPPTSTPRVPADVASALRVLGLSDPTTEVEIRKRRRELAFQHHPDRGGSTAQLIAVNAAASVLIGFYGING